MKYAKNIHFNYLESNISGLVKKLILNSSLEFIQQMIFKITLKFMHKVKQDVAYFDGVCSYKL